MSRAIESTEIALGQEFWHAPWCSGRGPPRPLLGHLENARVALRLALRGRPSRRATRIDPMVGTSGAGRLNPREMEGAVMLARTKRDLRPFDDAVGALRAHFTMLTEASAPIEAGTTTSSIGDK